MHFMLKATDCCNMNCLYCYVSKEQRQQNNCFPVEQMPRLFQQIFEWQQSDASQGELTFNWSGGEVLTLPISYWEEVFRIQNKLYSNGRFTFKIKNGIQTNLTLLTDEYYQMLHKNNVEIGTTIDGPRKCMDKTRQFWDGSSVFDTIMDKLQRLIEVHRDKPGVILILNKHNIECTDEIYRMFRELDLGFQINSYHYAPQSEDCDQENAITVKEHVKAMSHLFDLWSNDTKTVEIRNFERAMKFLQHGRVNLCSKTRNCTEYFFMVRWNGDVYPCNEFGGEDFEQKYCYGNLIANEWHQVRDHPNRKILLNRHIRLKSTPRKKGGCKGCKYWDGCHGGCMHSTMRFEYRNLRDHSPQKITVLRDIPNCEATIGVYKYIETQLRENAKKNIVPLLLHTDHVSPNSSIRRISFYRFHRERWKAANIDLEFGPIELSKTEVATLWKAIENIKNMLYICCGTGSLLNKKNGQDVSGWLGVDYRLNNNTVTTTLPVGSRIAGCSNIMSWQGWKSRKSWDLIVINPYLIYKEDLYKLLLLCKNILHNRGHILVYSRRFELQEREKLEVTDYYGVYDYDKGAIAINVRGLSMACLNKTSG